MSRYVLGLDVGGTFTDVILADRAGKALWVAKSPSVPSAPADGFFGGVDKMLATAGVAPDGIETVLHGSTVVTNAILENKGARTGSSRRSAFAMCLPSAGPRSRAPSTCSTG